jgi:hypothetical protein
MNNAEHDATGDHSQERHYSFVRRALFPYNGKEILTPAQTVRLMLSWVVFFFPGFLLLTLMIALLEQATLSRFLMALGLAILIDIITFGGTAWLSISVNNRAVRIQQARQAQRAQGMTTTSGGRYGS